MCVHVVSVVCTCKFGVRACMHACVRLVFQSEHCMVSGVLCVYVA